jgi:hypothetical protein
MWISQEQPWLAKKRWFYVDAKACQVAQTDARPYEG